jgi:N-acetylglutamate synthase-like GNAT family acetyltransferase
VRPARRGDLPEVASLLRELGYAEGGDSTTFSWVLSHPEMEVFVATDQMDRPIGVISMSHRPQLRLGGRVASIDELSVTEAWRGKGVGKELVARAVARGKVLGVKRIELATHRGRASYQRGFYEKRGFVEVDSAILRLAETEKVK